MGETARALQVRPADIVSERFMRAQRLQVGLPLRYSLISCVHPTGLTASCLLLRASCPPPSATHHHAPSELRASRRSQVREMVRTSYSHPSVILHGFFNEGPADDPTACKGYDALAAEIRTLVPSSHRLVTWASSAKTHDHCLHSADVLSFNECKACVHARRRPQPWPHAHR